MCDEHLRASAGAKFKLKVLALLASVWRLGGAWILQWMALAAACALYVPVMRTSILILVCHPQFQCIFPCTHARTRTNNVSLTLSFSIPHRLLVESEHDLCHRSVSKEKIMHASFTFSSIDNSFFSGIMILCFGIAFPLLLFAILWKRRGALLDAFMAPVYRGRFSELRVPTDTPQRNTARIERSRAVKIFAYIQKQTSDAVPAPNYQEQNPSNDAAVAEERGGTVVTPKAAAAATGAASPTGPGTAAGAHDHDDDGASSSTNASDMAAPDVELELATANVSRRDETRVAQREWTKFMISDESVIAPMIKAMKLEATIYAPIVLVMRV